MADAVDATEDSNEQTTEFSHTLIHSHTYRYPAATKSAKYIHMYLQQDVVK